MLKEKITVNAIYPDSEYNNWAFEHITNDKFNVLRARLLNLADSMGQDPGQRKAIKGLMKDFCNQAYYPLIGELKSYLKYFKVLGEGEDGSTTPLRDTELSIN